MVPIVGPTPGRLNLYDLLKKKNFLFFKSRYGHTLVYSKPFLIVFGGNTGNEPVNDVWSLNVEKAPFCWNKLDCGKGELPNARVYHAAALCQTGSANGMMVVFGGRTTDGSALNDTWGLRKHRDGRWDFVKGPYRNSSASDMPKYRY